MREKAVLVYIDLFKRPTNAEQGVALSVPYNANANAHFAAELQEFKQLVASTGAEIVSVITGKRKVPSAKYFVGTGKLEEIRLAVTLHAADLVIFDHELSPAQERNLEQFLKCRILGRTGLILDIFAQRARTYEGKLQVELAQLQHLSARLKRGWTHLERQRGGIGLRGPGETQLEEDRRVIRQKVTNIKKRLAKVRKQRAQSQRARRRAAIPVVTLIGYTNAGKSTLFNVLTKSKVYTADKLFATLDPTMRRMDIPGFGPIIFADTVGFISKLPHELVEAFRATLEETKDASLLLHIVDAADPEHKNRIMAVNEVLSSIGAAEVPQLIIYNKIDLLEDTTAPRIDYDEQNKPRRVWVSALQQSGLELMLNAVQELLQVVP